MRNWIARHETAAFLGLTFGLSWPLWIASGALGRDDIRQPDLRWLLAQIGVFAPAFAGMFVAATLEAGTGRRAMRTLAFIYLPATLLGWGIATRGYESFAAIGAGWTLALTAFGVWVLMWFGRTANRQAAWPGAPANAGTVARWTVGAAVIPAAAFMLAWAVLPPSVPGATATTAPAIVREFTLAGVLGALTVNLSYGGSLGEEPGWRGVWLPRLLRGHSPLRASLVIGFWWAPWHAPIDLAQGFGVTGVGALVVRLIWVLPVAVVFTWVTVRAGGSLLPPFAFHTSLNVLPDSLARDAARYERAWELFVVLVVATAFAVALRDRRFAGSAAGKASSSSASSTDLA